MAVVPPAASLRSFGFVGVVGRKGVVRWAAPAVEDDRGYGAAELDDAKLSVGEEGDAVAAVDGDGEQPVKARHAGGPGLRGRELTSTGLVPTVSRKRRNGS